jgi:PAS domain-containing protein
MKKSGAIFFILYNNMINENNSNQKPINHQDEANLNYFDVFRLSPISIERYDSFGNLQDVNQACLNLFGIKDAEAMQGLNLFCNPHLTEQAILTIRKGKPFSYQLVYDFDLMKSKKLYKTKRNGVSFLDCTINPVINTENEIYGYIVYITEITNRKYAEWELDRSDTKNKRQKEEVRTKKSLSELSAQLHDKEALKLIHKLEVNQIELELQNQEINFAKEQSEKSFERNEALLRQARQLTQVGGWEWSIESRTMYWTEEMYNLHDIEPGDFEPGTHVHIDKSLKCYRPEDRPVILSAFQKCMETGQAYDLEFPFTTYKGRQLWIRTITESVMENGHVVSVIGSFMDITDRKIKTG